MHLLPIVNLYLYFDLKHQSSYPQTCFLLDTSSHQRARLMRQLQVHKLRTGDLQGFEWAVLGLFSDVLPCSGSLWNPWFSGSAQGLFLIVLWIRLYQCWLPTQECRAISRSMLVVQKGNDYQNNSATTLFWNEYQWLSFRYAVRHKTWIIGCTKTWVCWCECCIVQWPDYMVNSGSKSCQLYNMEAHEMWSVIPEDRSKDAWIAASWKQEWEASGPHPGTSPRTGPSIRTTPGYIATYRTQEKASTGKICVENTGRL